MRNSKAVLIAAAIGTLTFGGAHAALAQSDVQTLSDKALYNMAQGDNWIATNQQKRVVAAAPTIQNRFNLATGYQRTGRLETAKTQYQALAAEGEGTVMEQGWRSRSFDAGLESADRLLYIDWLQNGARRGSGAASAGGAASNVSATVGGTGEYEVTDEQARALDRQARAR
ncbi:hypothetical protein [Caulobacter sp. 1776]|uniref:hypothetical protein n=1 Tax=Caulobacter sp. 1776 TaxID=3156420 RepID=UPI00339411FD